jgi:hypothetical protein
VSIPRERRRLARAFHAALLAAGSPAILIACGSSGSSATSDGGVSPGAPDATLESSVPRDGGAAEAEAGKPVAEDAAIADVVKPKPPVDAGSGGCYAGSFEVDAGPDANPLTDTCAYIYACGLGGTGLGASGCQVLQVVADDALAPIPGLTCWLPDDAGCENDALAPDNEAGGVTVYCTPCPTGGGRRPAGLRRPRARRAASELGAYLASMAFEEDASVLAFARMRAELEGLGAPASLLGAASRAAKDETRHARTMTRLATARGAVVARARVRRAPARGAAAIAAENAAEGCVRETYGALVARWQSLHAGSAELRRAFARIAAEEASHAALSWAVARWIEPQLGAAGRRRVARARSRALQALRASVEVEPSAELVRDAGLPSAARAQALLATMLREL